MHSGPFHEGEVAVQERVGVRDAALRTSTLFADRVPPRAISFLEEQRMLAVASVDGDGVPSASVLFGESGFVSTVDGRAVVVDRTRVDVHPADSVWSNLRVEADVGLLAIELSSRRRLRINGVVSAADEGRIEMSVREAYPNCPKYIQRRQLLQEEGTRFELRRSHARGVTLDELRAGTVERADTLFVASRHPTRGVDVSHRGGAPGFVRLLDSSRLRIPDYPGNNMFNTLGNFVADDRAGLTFLDFERGSLLQMIGAVELRLSEDEETRQPTGGTGRYWDFRVARWLELPMVAGLGWEFFEYSPHNPRTPG